MGEKMKAKKNIREILFYLNNAILLLIGTIVTILGLGGIIAGIVGIIWISANAGEWGGLVAGLLTPILASIMAIILLPIAILGILELIPIIFAIIRIFVKNTIPKFVFSILNILGCFGGTILLIGGSSFFLHTVISLYKEELEQHTFGETIFIVLIAVSATILVSSLLVLLLNTLLLIFTLIVDIPLIKREAGERSIAKNIISEAAEAEQKLNSCSTTDSAIK